MTLINKQYYHYLSPEARYCYKEPTFHSIPQSMTYCIKISVHRVSLQAIRDSSSHPPLLRLQKKG